MKRDTPFDQPMAVPARRWRWLLGVLIVVLLGVLWASALRQRSGWGNALVVSLAAGFLVWVLVGSFRRFMRSRRRLRVMRGGCLQCGYKLAGTVAMGQTVCPECGTPIDAEVLRYLRWLGPAAAGRGVRTTPEDSSPPMRPDQAE
ncbi:MAG: hypothetical protein AAF797_05640 [Planctomycetota bacterium]